MLKRLLILFSSWFVNWWRRRLAVFATSIGSINTIPGMQYDLFTFSLMACLTFGAGLTILLTGVRLMLGELIPVFKGISDKLII